MAIDESRLPKGTVGTHDGVTGEPDEEPGRTVDDFRLRLDSPLFHRDPGMSAARAPQLRELTWEHVVRPTHQRSADDRVGPLESGDHRSLPDTPLPGGAAAPPSSTGVVPSPLIELVQVAVEPVDAPLPAVPAVVPPSIASPATPDPVVAAVEEPAAADALPEIEVLLAVLDQLGPPNAGRPLHTVESEEPVGAPADAPAVERAVERVVERAVERAVEPPVRSSRVPSRERTVEAELNRLAFLPEEVEEAGPVEVPAISPTDHPVAAPMPTLSQHEMYSPRQSAPVAHGRANLIERAAEYAAPPRTRQRHVLRRFLTFVLLLGMLGGGLFAVKHYLLDTRWEGATEVLVGEVETSRGLSFDHAIPVTSLPVDEYASKLAALSLGITDVNSAEVAGEWRSLGLLTGELTLRSIGMAAMPDSPAFYDPGTETIYVADSLPPELYQFGMRRALTLALLDQQYDWGKRSEGSAPSIALGTRAFYDADALATAVALTGSAERSDIISEIFSLYGTYRITASPSPFASTVAGRLGVALSPYFASLSVADRDAVERDRSVSDAQVLDLRRLVDGGTEATNAQARGMLYWYHVLAARLDEDSAWQAALAWRGDDVSSVVGATGTCVIAHLQLDPGALDGAVAAFQAWAAAAPAASTTTVTVAPDGSAMQLDIKGCDPGAGVATNDARSVLTLGGAPLRAEQYHQLLLAQPALPPAQVACAVFAGDSVSLADERGVIDGPDGWSAPDAHPLPDPTRLGCAPA